MTKNTNSTDTPVRSDFGVFSVIPEWLLFHPDTTDKAIRLFAVLHRHDGRNGIYPSRTHLARLMGCSVNTIDRTSVALVKLKALRVETRYMAGGGHKTNIYHLVFTKPKGLEGCTLGTISKVSSKKADSPKGGDRGGLTDGARGSPTHAARNESQLNDKSYPSDNKPAKPASEPKPKKKPAKKKSDTSIWMEEQFAKLKQICPTAKGNDGYSLLNMMKKEHSPIAVISRSLDKLVKQENNLGIHAMWQYVKAECQRQQVAKVATKKGGPIEVSKANSRRTNQ